MSLPSIEVDLARPPRERWRALAPYGEAIRTLSSIYARDLGGLDRYSEALALVRDALVTEEHREEMDAIAAMVRLDPLELLLVNAYYDVFKHALACTAFALDMPRGPLHARNLDWWSEEDALAAYSMHVRFHCDGAYVFDAISWPGFIGALSGVAPGRFAVTLNAVLSDERPGVATPVALVLRDLLARATYEEARRDLATRPLSADCLLLVSGAKAGELCVIERTPSAAAVRGPTDGLVVVANDYRALEAPGWTRADAELARTSYGRFDRARARAEAERPQSAEACFAILDDPGVRMKITVQQMVFSAATGLAVARRG